MLGQCFFAVCAMLRHRHSLPQTRVTSHIVRPAPWPFPWRGLELAYHPGFFRPLFKPSPPLLTRSPAEKSSIGNNARKRHGRRGYALFMASLASFGTEAAE